MDSERMTTYGRPQAQKIVEMHEKGFSAKALSRALEIPLRNVNAILKVATMDRGTFDKVMTLKRTGMTDTDIAKQLGLSKQYVSRLTPVKRHDPTADMRSYTIRTDPAKWEKAMEKAESFGLICEDGLHAGRGSVKKLIDQIALGNLEVVRVGAIGDLI
jgi:hypothetical protein